MAHARLAEPHPALLVLAVLVVLRPSLALECLTGVRIIVPQAPVPVPNSTLVEERPPELRTVGMSVWMNVCGKDDTRCLAYTFNDNRRDIRHYRCDTVPGCRNVRMLPYRDIQCCTSTGCTGTLAGPEPLVETSTPSTPNERNPIEAVQPLVESQRSGDGGVGVVGVIAIISVALCCLAALVVGLAYAFPAHNGTVRNGRSMVRRKFHNISDGII